MKQSAFNFHQTTVKFFGPLKKHTFWTITASVFIGITLFIFVDIVLAEVVRQNSYNISVLSIEMLNELGPDYVVESKQHADMIKLYTDHMEQRQYAGILQILYPENSPKKALASALEDLEEAAKNRKKEEAKKTIWQAGLISSKLFKLGTRFPRSPIAWFKSEVVSYQLLKDLDNEFDKFHELSEQFEKAQTMEDVFKGSRDTCSSSRRALLLLSIARLGYDNEEKKIERFLVDLKKAHQKALLFAGMEKFKSEQKLFSDRAYNMNIRIKVIEAMLDDDMDRACEILKTATEEAEKEKGNAIS